MSWLFSQALVEEYSAATCSDGEPSAQWNVMPTPQGFWRNDKMMDASRLSQFGPTLRLLTDDHGEAVLTSFLAAFPARTPALQGGAKALTESAAASGLSSLESLAKYDRATSLWKTPQLSLLGDWELYSETWPRWGSMRNGECWVQLTWAPLMTATVSGSSERFPTPTVAMRRGSSEGALTRKNGRSRANDRLDYAVEKCGRNGRLNPPWVEWLMGWPIGWTALQPLATARFREWQQQHSPNYQEGSDAA